MSDKALLAGIAKAIRGAIGLHGYVHARLTGDTGSRMLLGWFKGEAVSMQFQGRVQIYKFKTNALLPRA